VSEVFPESPPSSPLTAADQLAHEAAAREQHAHGVVHDRAACGLCPPPATATPGQAAREAFGELGADWYPRTPWNGLHEDLRAQWDAAAQAAIARYVELNGRDPVDARALIAEVLGEQAAPELAAAMAETRAVRDGYQQLCGEFGPSAQSGWSARISLTSLNRHLARAGLAELPRSAASQRAVRPPELGAVAYEAAETGALRELAAEILREVAEWTIVGEDLARIAGWRKRAGLDGDGG
jgi:hypothetical protein